MTIINKATLTSKIDNGEGQKISVSANSNALKTNQIDTDIVLEKTLEKSWAIPEDKLTVTTKVINNSALEVTNPTFKDTLGNGASFVEGTVKIGSQAYSDANPITGFTPNVTLGADGAELEMSYQIAVDKYLAEESIANSTQMSVNLDSKTFTLNSNEATIKVLNNEVYLLKQANATAVKSGDTIIYTITISNDGELDNTNLFFTDPIPSGTTFVSGSVKVDNQSQPTYDPTVGFNLQDLSAGQSITIEFSVKVD